MIWIKIKSLDENQMLSFVALLLRKRWHMMHIYPPKKKMKLSEKKKKKKKVGWSQ